ncbi:MAG: XrtN system VIT domain-containing protein [Bacteroidia bacterium]|nr:XrtN system VIT domain-containing protein [Bacteroidia bacterium]
MIIFSAFYAFYLKYFQMIKLELGIFSRIYKIGWVLIFVSFLLFYFSKQIVVFNPDAAFLLFLLNFACAIGFYIGLIVIKFLQNKPRPKIPFACWVQFVLLFTISAFALNKLIAVFAAFPVWLNIYTFLGASLFVVFPFFNFFPSILKSFIWFALGIVLVITIYFNLYLLPLMPISVIGFFFFGISLHSFVPLLWLVLIVYLIREAKEVNWGAMAFGSAIPILVLIFYLNKWHSLQALTKDIQAQNNLKGNNQIPLEIALAQWLPSDKLSEEILLSPYYSQQMWGSSWGMDFNGENRYHNPLAILGTALFGEVSIDRNALETFLKIRRDQRHKTEERLWTGNNLVTNSVTTRIQVMQNMRLAYHEKTIAIHQNKKGENEDLWFVTETQQAIYTFHLPEGSIVNSLSLWINGKEEKSRLTTRKKADSAFKEIVGVEKRDPALVHWKEGNLVVVSVFPCTSKEDRLFKIGFTTPLKMLNKKLWVENIWFDGPRFHNAREVIEIIGVNNLQKNELPEGFFESDNGAIKKEGDYMPYWKFACNLEPLLETPFIFNSKAYFISEAKAIPHRLNFECIYFDLNNNWNKTDFDELRATLRGKKLFVLSPKMEKITDENADDLFEKYQKSQFSLPYFHLIEKPNESIVISNSGHKSPFYSELKRSSFGDKLSAYFGSQKKPILFVNIGKDLSPIYKTLNELRLIQYAQMDLADLKIAIHSQLFNWVEEDDKHIAVKEAKIILTQRDTTNILSLPSTSNHLMRLFTYNNVVRKIGKDFFNSTQYENALFREAEEAYVLSPVTSLIVLESEEDYNRMGIHKNNKTLGNAEIMEGGAVPEPHEWALLGVLILLFVCLKYKDRVVQVK